MSNGNFTIYPNSGTTNGTSVLQQSFNDLLANGIENDINLNGQQIINSGVQNVITGDTLINKDYADSHYSSGSGNPSFIQFPATGTATTKLETSLGTITASITGGGIINMKQNNPNPISVLINDPVSSANPVSLNYADTNYINKTQNIGLQSQNVPVTTSIDFNSHFGVNVLDPVMSQDIATKNYVDNSIPVSQTLGEISVSNPTITPVDMNNQQINNLLDGALDQDATTIKQLNDKAYIHDPTNFTRIDVSDTNLIQFRANDADILQISQENTDDSIIKAQNVMNLQSVGNFNIKSDSNEIHIQDSGNAQQLQLQLNQIVNGTDQISIIQAGTEVSNVSFGAVSNFTTGLTDVSNAYFVQNLGTDGHACVFSCGQALVNNSAVLFADSIETTYPIQTQFSRKTGYGFGSVAITEDDQFPTKKYVDDSISGLSSTYMNKTDSLATIGTNNPALTNIDVNSQSIINLSTTGLLGDFEAVNTGTLASSIATLGDTLTDYIDNKNFIEFTNINTKSRIDCNLNDIQIQPNTQSLSAQTLIMDCQNLPIITGKTGVVRMSVNSDIAGCMFLDADVYTRTPTEPEQICTKLYADGKLDGTFSLNDINGLNPDVLDMGTNAVYSSAIPAFDNQLTNKLYVDTEISGIPNNYYVDTTTLNNITLADGSLNLNTQKIINLVDGVDPQDGATTNQITGAITTSNGYTDTQISGLSLQTIFDQNPTDLALGNQVVYSTHIPNNVDEYCNKAYVDSVVSGGGMPSTATLAYISTTNSNDGDVDINSFKITNLTDPTTNQDASTKKYTDDQDNLRYLATTKLNEIELADGDIDANNQKIINLTTGTIASDACNWGQTYNHLQATLSGGQLDTLYQSSNQLSLTQQGTNNVQILRQGGNETVFDCLERLRIRVPQLFTIQGTGTGNTVTFADSSSTFIIAKSGSQEFKTDASSHIVTIGNTTRGSIITSPSSHIFNTNGEASVSIYDDGVSSGVVRVNLNGNSQPLSYFGVDGSDLLTQQLQIGSSTDTTTTRMKMYYNGLVDPNSGCPIDINKFIGYNFNVTTELANNNDFALISKGAFKNYQKQMTPIGTVISSAIPYNLASSMLPCYLPCDGSTINSGTYPLLFALIGANTPNYQNKYQRSGQTGDTAFTLINGENLQHNHDLSTAVLTMNSHTHDQGTLNTIANTTADTNIELTFSRSNQSGVNTPCLTNLLFGTSLANDISQLHSHTIPSLTVTGNTGSTTSTGSITGNSGNQGQSKIEVDSLLVFYYVKNDYYF